jgi:ABC-type transport system involved in multi-copper enzyme maturation permease subunit
VVREPLPALRESAMPIYDQSYKRWEGQLYPRGTRWLVIAQDSLRRSLRGKAIRLCLGIALIPFILRVVWIYIVVNSDALATYFPFWEEAAKQVNIQIDAQFYHDFLWYELHLVFFAMFICGCNLIAEDRRNNALSLYLSKALTRIDYLFGKSAGVAVPIALLTLIPSIILYVLHALFRNDWLLLFHDARILLAIVIQCMLVIVSGTIIMMAVSSCTKQGLYAAFGFIGLVLGGNTLQAILRASLRHTVLSSTLGSPKVQLLSLYHDWNCMGAGIFNRVQLEGFHRPWVVGEGFDWPWALLGIGLFVAISIWILHRQIRGLDIVK